MTVSRMRSGREAMLFVLITPLLMFFSVCLEQADPLVPGKFSFLVLLGPTLLVALTGKRWQGLMTALLCSLGCVAASWISMGSSWYTLPTTAMSMPVLLGGALLAVGTLLTLRCDEAERQIGTLDQAVSRIVSAEKVDSLSDAILDAASTLLPERPVELYVWEPREHGFVTSGVRNSLHPICVVPLFGGMTRDATLAPTLQDWICLDREFSCTRQKELRIPLTSGDDEVFGFLRIAGEESTDAEVKPFLQILAHFSGLAIKNVLLFERLREQARRDGLTGLINYAAFQEELSRALREMTEPSNSFALVLMDLDKFKQVNDQYGHHVGSLMLQTLAETLRRVMPHYASLARYGGDEFACILPHSDAAEAMAHMQRLKRELDEIPVHVQDERLTIVPSIGIALYPSDATEPEELFHIADQALYAAKRRGGGIICLASDAQMNLAAHDVLDKGNEPSASFQFSRSETVPMPAVKAVDTTGDSRTTQRVSVA